MYNNELCLLCAYVFDNETKLSIYKLKLKIKNLIMFINVWYVSVGL